jgi:hypothetical protein
MHGRHVFRHTDNMRVVLPAYLRLLKENDPCFPDGKWFVTRESKALGVEIRMLKPILGFPDGEVTLSYNVGTRGNGVDMPRWPKDLLTEIVL